MKWFKRRQKPAGELTFFSLSFNLKEIRGGKLLAVETDVRITPDGGPITPDGGPLMFAPTTFVAHLPYERPLASEPLTEEELSAVIPPCLIRLPVGFRYRVEFMDKRVPTFKFDAPTTDCCLSIEQLEPLPA